MGFLPPPLWPWLPLTLRSFRFPHCGLHPGVAALTTTPIAHLSAEAQSHRYARSTHQPLLWTTHPLCVVFPILTPGCPLCARLLLNLVPTVPPPLTCSSASALAECSHLGWQVSLNLHPMSP